MCDTKFSVYLYYVRLESACADGHVSLGFPVVGIF